MRALQISFLLGRQAMLGQEPPIHRRSTTAVRRPYRAMCQASNLPPNPLPRTKTSTGSASDMKIPLSIPAHDSTHHSADGSDEHYHFAAGLARLHHPMRFANLLKTKHAGWFCLVAADSHLVGDGLERYVRQRKLRFAEHKAAEKA